MERSSGCDESGTPKNKPIQRQRLNIFLEWKKAQEETSHRAEEKVIDSRGKEPG